MKSTDIIHQIARETGVTPGEAADCLDEVVSSILKRLKNHGQANFAGLGRFKLDVQGSPIFTQTRHGRSHDQH